MFGQNRPTFGAPSTNTFGSFGTNTSTGFGQSSFGAKPTGTAAPTFQPTGFGSNTSMFGSSATATSQPSSGLFGTPSATFGATQPTAGFGTPAPNTGFGGFGGGASGGSLFGTPAPSTGMFGSNVQPAAPASGTTGMFGAATNTGFGTQAKPAFGFGATSTSNSLFGQPQTQPTQTTSLFGQQTAQAAPSTGTGLFGSSSFGSTMGAFGSSSGTTGTTVKFNPPAGTDSMMKNNVQTTISTHHQCITCMKEYENKSLEELRFEDYSVGRKGPTPGAGPQPGGLFGATTATTQATPLFGTQQTPLFGTPASTMGQTSFFGQPQQQQAQQPAFGTKQIGFGQATTSTTSTFGFGQAAPQQQQASIFGQPQQAKQFGTSIFGPPTTSQPAPTFGTQAPATGFGFGTPQQTQSLFNAPKTAMGVQTSTAGFGFPQTTTTQSAGTNIFGAKPVTGFGATSTPAFGGTPAQTTTPAFSGFGTAGTGLFTPGQPAFGVKPAGPTFGTATSTAPTLGFGQTPSMFGGTSAASAKPGLFGTTTSFGSSGFGTTPSFGTNVGGMGTTAPGSLFGGTGIGAPTSLSFGTTQPAAGASTSQLPIHQYILTLSEISQSSDHPLFRKMLEPSGKAEELIKSSSRTSLSNGAAPTPPQYRISPMPSSKIRTKALLNGSSTSGGRRSIFEGLSDEEEGEETGTASEAKTDFFVPRRSVKKLQLKAITLDTTVEAEDKADETEPIKAAPAISPEDRTPVVDSRPNPRIREELDDSLTVLKIRRPTVAFLNQSVALDRSSMLDETGIGEGEVTVAEEISETVEEEIVPPHPAGIVLRRCGYSTIPTMEELAIKGLDESGKCIVTSFSIIRRGYGQIFFEGPLDVANLNLDEIVLFRHKEVTVYPDDSKKPPEGEGLNRRAEITLDRVWPVDKTTGEYITNPERLAVMRYEERLARAAHRLQAKFIEYRPETGSWVFRVNHFSKYGLEDSDEENELPVVPPKAATLPTSQGQAAQVTTTGAGLGGISTTIVQATSMSMTFEEDMGVEDDMVITQFGDGFEDSARIQSPPPVSTQLARTLGMPSQRVQIMKASFFDADNDFIQDVSMGVGSFLEQSVRMSQSIAPRKDMSRMFNDSPVRSPGSLFKSSAIAAIQPPDDVNKSHVPMEQTFNATTKMQDFTGIENLSTYVRLEHVRNPEKCRKVVPRFATAEVALSRSVMQGKFGIVTDAALFQNRQFRVGWGPDLHHLELKATKRLSLLTVKTSDLRQSINPEEDVFTVESKNPYVVFLATYLNHTKQNVVKGVPTLCPLPGSQAVGFLKAATESLTSKLKTSGSSETRQLLNYMGKVWNLCIALWGPLDVESGSHAETMARKETLTHWLEEAATETNITGLNEEEEVLTLLARHDVAGAARLAHKNGEYYLALLISQAGSSLAFKGMLQRQLHLWTENRADAFITEDRLRVFALLAGITVWETTHGKINTCEGMDWIKALAHHLWYVISPVGSITDALLEYEAACGISKDESGVEVYASGPTPSYSQSPTQFRDLCFQLISLYCHRTIPLEKLINPLSHTWNVCENVLSWLLWQQLQALGYSHLSETAAAQLTTAFASQLENCGLWHWAIFVAMHLKSTPSFIQSFVEDILVRHIGQEKDEKCERFLVEKLGIPQQWIEKSRAVRALYSFCPRLQATSLLAAGLYNQAHDVICDELAPEAILSESYQELEELLAPLADPERSSMIADWYLKGKVYWNYITVVKAVDRILKQDNSNEKGMQLEKLTPDLTSLCNLVSSLPVPTAKHRLVRTEIAQKAAYILKNVIGLQSVNASEEIVVPPRFVLPQLRQLPVTQDYSLSELNNVVRAYFLELKV